MIRAETGILSAGTLLYRVYDPQFGVTFKWVAPLRFRGGRFDCVDGTFGFAYFADQPGVALAEVFARDIPSRPYVRQLPAQQLVGAHLLTVHVRTDIKVQLLHSKYLTRIGDTVQLTKSDPADYDHSRSVAARLVASHTRARGLRYRPRHDEDGFAVMLYQHRDTSRVTDDLDGLIEVVDDLGLHSRAGIETAALHLAGYGIDLAE